MVPRKACHLFPALTRVLSELPCFCHGKILSTWWLLHLRTDKCLNFIQRSITLTCLCSGNMAYFRMWQERGLEATNIGLDSLMCLVFKPKPDFWLWLLTSHRHDHLLFKIHNSRVFSLNELCTNFICKYHYCLSVGFLKLLIYSYSVELSVIILVLKLLSGLDDWFLSLNKM